MAISYGFRSWRTDVWDNAKETTNDRAGEVLPDFELIIFKFLIITLLRYAVMRGQGWFPSCHPMEVILLSSVYFVVLHFQAIFKFSKLPVLYVDGYNGTDTICIPPRRLF